MEESRDNSVGVQVNFYLPAGAAARSALLHVGVSEQIKSSTSLCFYLRRVMANLTISVSFAKFRPTGSAAKEAKATEKS